MQGYVNQDLKKIFLQMLKQQHGKITKQKCPKHHVHMIAFQNVNTPVCPVDYLNELQRKTEQDATRIFDYHEHQPLQKRKYNDSQFLYQHSILKDPRIMQADFNNFKTSYSKDRKTNQKLKKIKSSVERTAQAYTHISPQSSFNTILAGEPGRGKSHLAMSILKYVNQHINREHPSKFTYHYPRCMFVDINEVMRLIKDSYGNKDSLINEEQLVSVLSSVYLLVIDDLGSEQIDKKQDNFEYSNHMTNINAILYEILNSRTRTIITTNFSIPKMKRIYGEKLTDRILYHAGNSSLLFADGLPDYRMANFHLR